MCSSCAAHVEHVAVWFRRAVPGYAWVGICIPQSNSNYSFNTLIYNSFLTPGHRDLNHYTTNLWIYFSIRITSFTIALKPLIFLLPFHRRPPRCQHVHLEFAIQDLARFQADQEAEATHPILPPLVSMPSRDMALTSSKHRKTKCDKAQPCSTCVLRKEAEACHYDDGSTPPPTQTFVTQDEFQALRVRIDEMARTGAFCQAHHHTRPSSHSQTQTHHDYPRHRPGPELPPLEQRAYDKVSNTRAEQLEVAVSNLEDLVDPYEIHGTPQIPTPANSTPQDSSYRRPVRIGGIPHHRRTKWPDITACSIPVEQRSARWMRDMGEIVNAIPTHHVLTLAVDHYFKELKQSREYPALACRLSTDAQERSSTKAFSGVKWSSLSHCVRQACGETLTPHGWPCCVP